MATETNLSAAERLKKLQTEVAAWNADAKRRRTFGTILLFIIVVGTAAYLGFAYARFSEVRPNEVIALAEMQLEPVLHFKEAELTQHFVDAAPAVIAKVEEGALELPGLVEGRFYAHLSTELDTHLPQLEQQLATDFRGALVAARDHATASGRDVNDPKQIEALMAEIAQLLRQEMQRVVEQFYADYSRQATDLTAYLNLLAEGQDLDERQKLQRDILIHFFALIEHYQTHGAPELTPKAESADAVY